MLLECGKKVLVEIVRWIICIPLAVCSISLTAYNGYVGFKQWTAKSELYVESVAPLTGGIAGALALFICPIDEIWKWFWIPLLVDYGTGFYCVGGLVCSGWLLIRSKL